jgi:DNA-binding MarR family transcriptional regulator
MSSDLEQLEKVLGRLHRAWSRNRRWESITLQAGVNLDRTSAVVLQVIAHSNQAAYKLHEVAEALGIEAPAVTRKVQLLEELGLLKKQADKKDGRAFVLRLTLKGQTVAERLHEAKRDYLRAIVRSWTATERRDFVRLLDKFTDGIIADSEQSLGTIKKV